MLPFVRARQIGMLLYRVPRMSGCTRRRTSDQRFSIAMWMRATYVI